MREKNIARKRNMSLFEISLLVLATFAFAYILSPKEIIPVASAAAIITTSPSCCELTNTGARCTEFAAGTSSLESFILSCPNEEKLHINTPCNSVPACSGLQGDYVPPVTLSNGNGITVSPSCCELKTNGAKCADITNSNECSRGLNYGVLCRSVSNCMTGCCYNDSAGIYDNNAAQGDCKATFVLNDPYCVTVPGARKGCCVVGGESFYVNSRECQLRTPRDKDLNWSSDLNEAQCILMRYSQDEGACISNAETGECRFLTRQDCISLTGKESSFFANYLCTSKELNTSCEKTRKTSCFPGKDGVYFVDSCDNRANIYDSAKADVESYWNNVVALNASCGFNADNGNANSPSCGNCNRFDGGICRDKSESGSSVTYGDNICQSTSCTYKGKSYENGESWCEYDSDVGNDVPGARHWKYVCNQGKVDIENCGDYRNRICVQKNMFEVDNQQITFANANCVPNNWLSCLELNNEKGDMTGCAEAVDCMIKNITIDKFNQNFCLPKYPAGFDFQSEEETSGFSSICGIGSRQCVIKEKCEYDCEGKLMSCTCVENCDCEKQGFTDKMNDICTSIGDCGLKFNLQGKSTKNFQVLNGTKDISAAELERLKLMKNPIEGKFALPGNTSDILAASGLVDNTGTEMQEAQQNGGPQEKEEDSGMGIADIAIPLGIAGLMTAITNCNNNLAHVDLSWIGKGATGVFGGFKNFGTTFIGTGLGYFAGGYISTWMGHTPGSTGDYMVRAGTALIGGSLGYNYNGDGLSGALHGAAFWIGAGLILASYFFMEDEEEQCEENGFSVDNYRAVTFLCNPWTPPSGGGDCEKCNNNPLRPCSEYSCASLGSACSLLNKGTDHEICANANPGDVSPPELTGTVDQDTRIKYNMNGKSIEVTGRSGGCLDAYTTYIMGIKTNEPAECRYDFTPKEKFEDFESNFGNGYVYNHVQSIFMPNPSAISNWNGKLTMYVKCRDIQGNQYPLGGDLLKISMCVNPARDITPPLVSTAPENGSYVKRDVSEKQVLVFTNEPAECKYSKNDIDYDLMENSLTCNNQLSQLTFRGYVCNTSLLTPDTVNKYFIRCKDQPWITGVNASLRIPNRQSKELTLLKATTQLNITGVAPNSEFEANSPISVITLKAITSGGAVNTSCFYSFTGYDNMIEFRNNEDSMHEQIFDGGLPAGDYRIYIECRDIVEDFARSEARFKIVYDESPTEIARIININNELTILTEKDRECRYSVDKEDKCNFYFASGTPMGISKTHSISITKGTKYFIKCLNKFGESPIGCTAIVSPV